MMGLLVEVLRYYLLKNLDKYCQYVSTYMTDYDLIMNMIIHPSYVRHHKLFVKRDLKMWELRRVVSPTSTLISTLYPQSLNPFFVPSHILCIRFRQNLNDYVPKPAITDCPNVIINYLWQQERKKKKVAGSDLSSCVSLKEWKKWDRQHIYNTVLDITLAIQFQGFLFKDMCES